MWTAGAYGFVQSSNYNARRRADEVLVEGPALSRGAAARDVRRSGARRNAVGAAAMILFPAFLKLSGRRCLVVGGGPVAEEKIEGLLRAGADVRVVAPEATGGFASSRARKNFAGMNAHFARPIFPAHFS